MAYRKRGSAKFDIGPNTQCKIFAGSHTDDTENTIVREIYVNEKSTPEEYDKAVKYVTGFKFYELRRLWEVRAGEGEYEPIFLYCESENGDFGYLKDLNVNESMFTEIIKRVRETQKDSDEPEIAE